MNSLNFRVGEAIGNGAEIGLSQGPGSGLKPSGGAALAPALSTPMPKVAPSIAQPKANIIHDQMLDMKDRLPKKNGEWEGEPGNSDWKSNIPEVNEVTGGDPIPFKNNRPIFDKWSRGDFELEGLNGENINDFNILHQKMVDLGHFKNKAAAKKWLQDQELTPHHKGKTTIQLIPYKLHSKIPHTGSASDMRN
ncbi:HNH endonuclease [Emticicia sp. C21]|uniref:HNH endonuclease n=1 Tax=Emticicia sp. C21 TaxID=2302915 RepID=UPI000E349355|nr:HNH endonuclease [Emticicia sp. C21]RFS14941.1 hypothetical protein D0T08_17795 [Emticicia sp. C21]